MRRVCRKTWRGENRIVTIGVVEKDGDTPLAGVEEDPESKEEGRGNAMSVPEMPGNKRVEYIGWAYEGNGEVGGTALSVGDTLVHCW